jgi:hypothetical protein
VYKIEMFELKLLIPRSIFLGLFALIVTSGAWAEVQTAPHLGRWRAIVFGGVDLASQAENNFQKSMTDLSASLVQSGWEVVPLFGNEAACLHCQSSWSVDPIAKAAGIDPSQVAHASKRELLKALDQAIQELGEGDQLLVDINTHGIVASFHGAPTTRLAVFDENDPRSLRENFMDSSGNQIGTMNVNDVDVVARYQKLRQKGVRLAFGNDSCFSGPTAKVLEPFGCVITQTSAAKYGLGSPVSDSIVALLNKNSSELSPVTLGQNGQVTMEDVFLRTTTYATYGINSPYYTTPFAGVLEPQFSAYLGQYDSVEALSGNWLFKLPKREMVLENNQLKYTGSEQDFTELKNFVQTYMAKDMDPSDDLSYQVIASFHLKPMMNVLASTKVESPSELLTKVLNLDSDLKNASLQFSALQAEQAEIQSKVESSGVLVGYTLDADYADVQMLFEQTMHSLNGKGLVLTRTSSNSMSSPWVSIELSNASLFPQRFFSPQDSRFLAQASIAALTISNEMAKSWPFARSTAFKSSLSATIMNAEKLAWENASDEAKESLNRLNELPKMQAELRDLSTLGDGRAIVKLAIEARIYSYLIRHKAAANSDADVQACQGFILKN